MASATALGVGTSSNMSLATPAAATDDHCFLQVSIAGCPPQRIVIRLLRETVPKTCQNFASLISAPGFTSPARPLPTYRGSIFHRIVPKFMVQGGDFEKFDGTGGHAMLPSSNSKTFPDESFAIPHDKAGVLSMANKGKDTNGSQFFITLQPTPHLNKKHVAFGRVVKGMEVVQSMAEDVELEGQRPTALQKIVIVNCGMGTGTSGTENESSDDNSQDHTAREKQKEGKREEKKKRKHSKKHKKKRHRDRRDGDSSSEDSERDRKRRKKDKHKRKSHSQKRKDRKTYSNSSSNFSSSTELRRAGERNASK